MQQNKYVETVTLATERDKKVGFAAIRIGDISIKGLTVWQSSSGKLAVFFPSYNIAGRLWGDSVEVPPEIRAEIESEVIAAYRARKHEHDAEAAKVKAAARLAPTTA